MSDTFTRRNGSTTLDAAMERARKVFTFPACSARVLYEEIVALRADAERFRVLAKHLHGVDFEYALSDADGDDIVVATIALPRNIRVTASLADIADQLTEAA